MECHGGRIMECHDDRKRRTRESNVALQDLENTTLSTRAARGGKRQWCWETTRQRASEHVKRTRPDWMMLETRCQKLGQGQRTVYEQAKMLELQNTVMDDRRADPQRVIRADPQRVKRAQPTAGKKRRLRQDHDEVNSKMSVGKEVLGVMNRADNTGAKNLDIMIVKSISVDFENNAGVIVNVKGDEGFGDHETSGVKSISDATDSGVAHTAEQLRVTFECVQRADGSVEHQENPHRRDLHSAF